MDFDAAPLYYSHQNLQTEQRPGYTADGNANNAAAGGNNAAAVAARVAIDEDVTFDDGAVRRHFREFFSESLFGANDDAVVLPFSFARLPAFRFIWSRRVGGEIILLLCCGE